MRLGGDASSAQRAPPCGSTTRASRDPIPTVARVLAESPFPGPDRAQSVVGPVLPCATRPRSSGSPVPLRPADSPDRPDRTGVERGRPRIALARWPRPAIGASLAVGRRVAPGRLAYVWGEVGVRAAAVAGISSVFQGLVVMTRRPF